jgi:uncharacterized linocin/CFP29 family protein
MTTTVLSDTEIEHIAGKIIYAHELGVGAVRRVLPYENLGGFKGYTEKFYDVKNTGVPMESKFLTATQEVKAVMEEHEVNVVWHRLNFALPYDEVQASLSAPPDEGLRGRTMNVIGNQMARMEASFVFKGASTPSITGFISGAGNTSTYTTTRWDVTKGPMLTVQNMINTGTTTLSSKFGPPYDLFMSSNLWPYLVLRNSMASVTEFEGVQGVLNPPAVGVNLDIESATGGSVGNVHILNYGTNTFNTIYPLPAATSNDGVLLLVKSHPDNVQVLVVHPLTVVVDPQLNTDSMTYNGTVFAALSNRIWDSTAMCGHVTVDATA